MKYIPIFYCLLSIALAVREKQLNLEDIEKDNLASERRTHQGTRPTKEPQQLPHQYISPPQPTLQLQQYLTSPHLAAQLQQQQYITLPQQALQQLQQQYLAAPQSAAQVQHQHASHQAHQTHQSHQSQQSHHRQPITPPQMQYGFKPMKTQPQVTEQAPRYTPSQQHFNLNLPAQTQQYSLPQYFAYQPTQQHQQQQQYLEPAKAQQYVQNSPQYQQLDLSYITDNHLAAQGTTNDFQQYYNPQQLFYLQQYPQASTNIQTVVDPKGGVQYVMYVPAQYVQGAKGEQSQNVEALLQAQDQQLYTTQDYNSAAQGLAGGQQQYQYVDIAQAQAQAQAQQPQAQIHLQHQLQLQPQLQLQLQEQVPKFQDIQYVQQTELPKTPKYEFAQQKYEPKSLLDSYVPSHLQVQYYKQQQQQAQANAIRESLKVSQPIAGKNDFSKKFVPQTAASPSFNYHYSQYASRPLQVGKH